MNEALPIRHKGVGPAQQKILESYVNAYPGVDVDALAANLALATLSTSLRESFEEKIRSLGFSLSRPRYTVVRTLYLSPRGQLPKAEIAEVMRVSGAYITQLLGSLESEGWVERIRDHSDSRVSHVRLTEAGVERCSRLVPRMMRHMIDACSALSKEELDQLLSMIGRISERAGSQATAVPDLGEIPS